MNRRCALATTGAFLLGVSALALSPLVGETYDLSWFTIDGGGGTSTGTGDGGEFSLSGTIGQHDAGGPLTGTGEGGEFLLTGGFWSGGGPADNTVPADLLGCSIPFGSTDNDPCDVANLLLDDDVDQILRSQNGFTAFERYLVEIVITGNGVGATTMASIETRDGSDTTNVVAKVKARNYSNNSVQDIAQYPVNFPSADTPHSTPVNSADFVDANGDVEIRIRYVAPATFTPLGFTVGLDQVQLLVQ